MNSLVLVQVPHVELGPLQNLLVQYGTPLSVLSDHLHLPASLKIIRRPERPFRANEIIQVDALARYQLFQTNQSQSLSQVHHELANLFWHPLSTRPLMHLGAKFAVKTMPDRIVGLGSYHTVLVGRRVRRYFPCLVKARGKWALRGVELDDDQDVSTYTFVAWR